MMNSLKRLVGATTTDEPRPDKIGRIEAKLAEVQQALEVARTNYQTACADVELGDDPAADQRLASAIEALRLAEQREKNLSTALAAAKADLERKARAAAAADLDRRWAEILKLADKRETLGAAIDKHAAGLAEVNQEVAAINARIRTLCAGDNRHGRIRFDNEAALVHQQATDVLARLALVRAGERWAVTWIGDVAQIPLTADKMRQANAELARFRRAAE